MKIKKIQTGERVFILKKESSYYHEINAEELSKWVKDGSISEGDLIIISKKVYQAVKEIKLNLEEQK